MNLERVTLLDDIRAVGASKLKGRKYLDINLNKEYIILKGYPGVLKAINSSFKVLYNGTKDPIRILAKDHPKDTGFY